jgi:hypothetical protein
LRFRTSRRNGSSYTSVTRGSAVNSKYFIELSFLPITLSHSIETSLAFKDPLQPLIAHHSPLPRDSIANMATTLVPREKTAVSDFQYYYYEPSMPAAALFVVLFGLATLLHLFQMIKSRTWFLIPFVIGGIFEAIGYAGRVGSASENPGPYSMGPYIIQAVLILVAPALFAASIYMELARIVHMVDGDSALFIRRTWLTKIFVLGDVFAFFLQAGGAGLLASGSASTVSDISETRSDIMVVSSGTS